MEIIMKDRSGSIGHNNVNGFVSYLSAFCIFCYVYYTQLFPTMLSLGIFLFGFVLILSKWIKTCGGVPLPSIKVMVWLLFSLFAVFSALFCGRLSVDTIVLFLGTFILYMVSMSPLNFAVLYKTSLVMLIPHAVATILFFIFPSLYTTYFHPLFMADVATAANYQSGLTSHYSYNAMYLVTGMVLSFVILRSDISQGKRLSQTVFALFFVALVLTTKRAHIGFGILSCVAMYLWTSRDSAIKPVLICCIGLLLSFLLILSENSEYMINLFDKLLGARLNSGDILYDITTGRTELWSYALDGWLSHPLFGNGWDSFRMVWSNGVSVSVGAHNVYLQLLYETGIIGCAWFVALQVYAGRSAFLVLKQSYADSSTSPYLHYVRLIALFACGYQLFFFLYCFTGNPLYDPQMFFVFLLAVSSINALLRDMYGKVNCEHRIVDTSE